MSSAKAMRLTEQERHALRLKRGHERARKRRSENTKARTLEQVRSTLHDAHVQIGAFARKNRRTDLHALSYVLGSTLLYLLSPAPSSGEDLERSLRKIGADALGRFYGEETWARRRETGAWRCKEPDMHVQVTHEGLAELQSRVAARIAAGTLPAEPRKQPLAGVTDFAEAKARILADRAREHRREP